MDYRKFQEETLKKRGKKHFKISNSFGVYDIYKAIRKHKWFDIGRPLTEHEFYGIVRGVNKLLKEELLQGNPVVFPHRMGKLELRKKKRAVSLIDNKLKIGYPVNWEATIRLWYEDEEAKKDKTLVRHEGKFTYRVLYDKYNANYENKSFYEFQLNRFIKQELKNRIKNGLIDTIW